MTGARTRGALLVLVALTVAGCTPDAPRPRLSGESLETTTCASFVERTLDEWSAEPGYLELPRVASERVARAYATEDFGVWVTVRMEHAGAATVARHDSLGVESRRNDASCTLSVFRERRKAPGPRANVVGDSDVLAALEAAAGSLIVYSWSPHMPLSVDGFGEVVEAADTRGFEVLPVLIAYGDIDFAEREASRVGMPEGATRQLHSVELLHRGSQLHAPSIVVFHDGAVAPVLPGYRDADGYGRFLDAVVRP